ncbi:MAG: response regulator transcription factor [Tissierellia bacterium]|nr:response regulator transcription factor [Tissierellia bacterium]
MKIIIIDDDVLVVESLKMIFTAHGIDVVAEGYSGREGVLLYEKHRPDVLLMDIRMDDQDGITATKEIMAKDPNAKILLLTTFQDEEYINKALHYGASGYILKSNIDSLIPSVQAVYSGNTVLDREIVGKLTREKIFDDNHLTPRESDILKLVAEGFSNREIAQALYLSEGTVRNYLSNLLTKLELRDRTQLAIYYYKR